MVGRGLFAIKVGRRYVDATVCGKGVWGGGGHQEEYKAKLG